MSIRLTKSWGEPVGTETCNATMARSETHLTQAWLAVGDDQEARRSGGVIYHRRPADTRPAARDPDPQDCLLDYRRERSGVAPA